MRILPLKTAQGWSHEVHVLMTEYWLAHDLSYSLVSQTFHVPMSTVCRLVHSGVEKIAALRQEVIRLPTAGDLEEVGQTFSQLANSPVFSRCVGSIDGCHVRIKTPQDPEARITSTESSSRPYNCKLYVTGRASSSTPLLGILAPSMTPES